MSTSFEKGANALKVVNRGLYSGVSNFTVSPDMINELYANGKVTIPEDWEDLHPNHFLILKAGDSQSAMARVQADRRTLSPITSRKDDVWSIFPRNKEQLFAMDLLLDDSIRLVTLSGVAGTGKTLVSLACALKQTADAKDYRKILVGRPVIPMGRDLGYLPGDLNEKMSPWIQPIYDNLEFLVDSSGKSGSKNYQYLLDTGIIKVEALTYIRGRSIPKQFIIIDEAQNLTPHEVKTILTRAGDGTKVVLTGDPQQIDKHGLGRDNNGLTYVAERFKDERIAGHVTLLKCERSELAEIAARLL